MILLAVPVPLAVWLILARYFASKTDNVKTTLLKKKDSTD
jgi:hypothetical protein